MYRSAFAAVCLVTCSLVLAPGLPCRAGQAQVDELRAARAQLSAQYPMARQRLGSDQAADLLERLDEDFAELSVDMRPDTYPVDDWNERLSGVAALDASLVRQVLSGD